jgi:RNase P subunit RPR2
MGNENHNIRLLRISRAKGYASLMRLGDYIDDYCTRCKRTTDHAVVSMMGEEVLVTRCRTCSFEHKYKHNKGSKQMTNKEAFDKVLASVMGQQGTAPEAKPKRRKKP